MHLLKAFFKRKKLNKLFKRLSCLAAICTCIILNQACGKRKPPLPPVERVPQRVELNGLQIGNQIRLTWQMPARNASASSTLNIKRADIYRLAEPLNTALSLTEDEFASRSTLIASVPLTDSDFSLKEKTYPDILKFAGQAARLRYAIRFVNNSGQKAAFSNFLIIEPSSRVAEKPSNLRSKVTQEHILLTWNKPQKNVDGSIPPNILGFNLYRSNDKNLTRRLNEQPLSQNSFEDKFFAFAQEYKYFVRTVSIGIGGNQVESISSDPLKIKPVDTFAPKAPEAITIASAPNSISIFFAVNMERDVDGYKIFRSSNASKAKAEWTLLTKKLLKANTFQDKNIESGKTYFYYLTAVDKFGNESQPSQIVSDKAF